MMLAAETPSWHFHVGGLTIVEVEGEPRAALQRIADELELRLPLAPKLTWKLRTVPFGLDLPVWVPDESFDLRRHVHFVTLASPAGRREVAALAGRVMSHQLDRRYPLWEMYLVDGLGNNRIAVIMKCHHSLMDGVSGASLVTVLNDVEPHPVLRKPRVPDDQPAETPSRLALLAGAIPRVALTPLRLGRSTMTVAQRLATVLTFSADGQVYRYTGAPRMSFNRKIGPARAFGLTSVAMADVVALKKKFDVKLNDVILALCAGALRNYLDSNGEHAAAPLVAGVPVSTRGTDMTMDNQIGMMALPIATDVDDPVERLLAIHRNAQAAKALHHEIRTHDMPSLGAIVPPSVTEFLMRALSLTHLANYLPTPMNTVISNVPGPSFDLYMAGGRVTGIFPTSVIVETMGLNITLFSYGERVDFGVYAEPQAVPDPFLVADGIPMALSELLHAAGLGRPTPVIDAFGESTKAPGAEAAVPARSRPRHRPTASAPRPDATLRAHA